MHSTDDLDDGYLGSGTLLHRAIKKHGKSNFKRDILFQFGTFKEMDAKETEIVNETFVARKDTYNIALGGHSGNTLDPEWQKENSLIVFIIQADRFLHGMVRALVDCGQYQ